jgi:hypothetical protein
VVVDRSDIAGSLTVLALAVVACEPARGSTPEQDSGRSSEDAAVDGGASSEMSDAARVCRSAVRGPSGIHAASGVQVYLAARPGEDPRRTGACGQCIAAGEASIHDVTGPDGTFELSGVPRGEHEIVIEKGLFQRRVEITVSCDDVSLDEASTALPRDSTEGRVPRIAVILGPFDAIETVLSAVGIGEIDLVEPSDAGALVRDPATLSLYDYVFVDCGAGVDSGIDDAIRANLRAFVEGGGRLYVTDQAYDVVEQTYPRALDYAGRSPGDGLSELPEPLDAAQHGRQGAIASRIHDDTLREWLDLHGVLDGEGHLFLRGLAPGWALIDGAASTSTTWVSGPADGARDRPLTVTFQAGCGMVLYTSYHTSGGTSGPLLGPQETILAYLAFEIASCIEDPFLF